MQYVKETKDVKYGDYMFDMPVVIARQVSTPEASVAPDSVTRAIRDKLSNVPEIGEVCCWCAARARIVVL
jgi:hypothetical protein